MVTTPLRHAILVGLIVIGMVFPALAQDIGTPDKAATEQAFPKRAYSPYTQRNFPTRPYFGDTHLHTGFSMDAGAFGARTLQLKSSSPSLKASSRRR